MWILKSSKTQTLITFFIKPTLTGSVVLARILITIALIKEMTNTFNISVIVNVVVIIVVINVMIIFSDEFFRHYNFF